MITASYVMLRPAAPVARTRSVSDLLMYDLDEDGHVVGIENAGGAVSESDILAVLMHVTS